MPKSINIQGKEEMVKKIALYISVAIVLGVVVLLIVLSNMNLINLSPFDVNVSVGNSPPQIDFVGFTNSQANLSGVQKVSINFTASDGNGASNLNDASARVEIFNLSLTPAVRVNSTCISVGESGNARNYTCEVGMWYFDPYGQYIVNVTISDNGGLIAENSSKIFSYSKTNGVDIYPTGLTWPAITTSSINVP